MKRIKIITLLFVYCVFLLLLFSETFLSDLQEARRNILVNNKSISEILFIPTTIWETISTKKEFNYKGIDYDTKRVTYQKNNVKVEVVKDKYEYIFKNLSKNLHSKSKKNQSISSKKLIDLYYSKIITISLQYGNKRNTSCYNHIVNIKSNYLFSLFRPPLFI